MNVWMDVWTEWCTEKHSGWFLFGWLEGYIDDGMFDWLDRMVNEVMDLTNVF